MKTQHELPALATGRRRRRFMRRALRYAASALLMGAAGAQSMELQRELLLLRAEMVARASERGEEEGRRDFSRN